MSLQIVVVFVLNFIISLIGTLAYSVRLVGVRTGKIAVSFALFNILMLVSRIAVTFQVPILTKYVEVNPDPGILYGTFKAIIAVSGIAAVAGAFFVPTFQRILTKGVRVFSIERSVPRLLLYSFSKTGIRQMRECVAIPSRKNVAGFKLDRVPKRTLALNLAAVAVMTAGAFAPIYAGSIEPDLRATCITLSSVINGAATILMTVFIDPRLSIMTDDVIDGKCSEEDFRLCIAGMVGSKAVGTFASLLLFLPASHLITTIARAI